MALYDRLSSVTVTGDPGARCALLSARLEAPIYRPPLIYTVESAGWPGDWEGRTILALTCLCRVTKREPSFLDSIVEGLPGYFNEKGYLGKVLPEGEFDEQQLSGHSWLLRGLCEYYIYRRCPMVLTMIDGIVEGLFLPALGKYESYPSTPEERLMRGGAESGSVAAVIGSWHISTDTGCAFIPLDGLSHAYELLTSVVPRPERDKKLLLLIDSMIDKFSLLPFIEACVQTHATLTGCRGIMRMYSVLHKAEYLDTVKRLFGLYEGKGMTANFENFNWFCRPEWTEPCAVIDSFMLACQLWEATGQRHYGEIAQSIMYNGMYRTQRKNGGFGCDSCAEDGYLGFHCEEAFWCCSMRGGEGLASSACYAVSGDGVILYPHSGIFSVNGKVLKMTTDYPHEGRVIIEHTGRVRLFIPGFIASVKASCPVDIKNGFAELDINGRAEIELEMPEYSDIYKGKRRYFKGPLMLGERNGKTAAFDREYLQNEEYGQKIKILFD